MSDPPPGDALQPVPSSPGPSVARHAGEAICRYCGAPLNAFYYFCLACGTPFQPVESVLTPLRPIELTDGQRVADLRRQTAFQAELPLPRIHAVRRVVLTY